MRRGGVWRLMVADAGPRTELCHTPLPQRRDHRCGGAGDRGVEGRGRARDRVGERRESGWDGGGVPGVGEAGAGADHVCGARAEFRGAQRGADGLAERARGAPGESRRRRAESAGGSGAVVAAREKGGARYRVWPLRGEAALGVAQFRELVYEPHDRLGAGQAAGFLSLELSLRERVCGEAGDRIRRALSVH